LALLVLVVFSVVTFACQKIVVRAPEGKNVTLASGAISNYDYQKRVFYVLWGLVPLGDNSTADLLANVPDGSKVLVQTELTFVDYLITGILSVVSVCTKTVGVQVVK